MKRSWILFGLFLFLVGCQAETAEPSETAGSEGVNSKATPISQVAGESVAPTESATGKQSDKEGATLNDSLSDALFETVRKYGIMNDAAIMFNDIDKEGVLYAELIDVDADGQEELYILSKTIESKTEWQEEDETIFDNFYVHDLWQAGVDGATHVFTRAIEADGTYCESCGYSVGFSERTDSTWSFEVTADEFFDEGARFTSEVYTLVDGTMQQDIYVHDIDEADNEQLTRNGQPIDGEQYRAERSGEHITIIENTIGQMNFAFDGAEFKFDDTDSSAAVISHVFAQLNSDKQPPTTALANTQPLAETLTKLEVFEFVDAHDPALHPLMLYTLLWTKIYLDNEPNVEDAIAEEYSYLAFSEALVLQEFERLYGVPFAGEDYGLLEPSFENNVNATYQDGVFYTRGTELGTPATIYDIEQAYEISPNTYYIQSTVRLFDWLNYTETVAYEEGFELDHHALFADEPIDTWPHELRSFTVTGLTRYTVVQQDGEDFVLKYHHYVPLSNAELELYK